MAKWKKEQAIVKCQCGCGEDIELWTQGKKRTRALPRYKRGHAPGAVKKQDIPIRQRILQQIERLTKEKESCQKRAERLQRDFEFYSERVKELENLLK